MWAAASSDIIATHFWLTMEGVIHTLQALLIVGPIIAYFVTKRICLALQKKDREIALHGYESGRIVRLPGGEYIEVHQPVDEYDRYKLVDHEIYEPLVVRPNAKGRIPWHENLRASISRWFFEDRLSPVTQGELDAALAHQHHSLDHIAAEEDAELQGAHERAGVPDAPHTPIDDGRNSETAVRPSNVIVPEAGPGTTSPRNRDKESGE
jgi:ubiquinol-cytochrome c reductase cytochrome b subunit